LTLQLLRVATSPSTTLSQTRDTAVLVCWILTEVQLLEGVMVVMFRVLALATRLGLAETKDAARRLERIAVANIVDKEFLINLVKAIGVVEKAKTKGFSTRDDSVNSTFARD
jgi:hypothetical protein